MQWGIALAVALLIGIAATLYFRAATMRRDETDTGIAALSAMSWREFIHLVLDALARRGYTRVFDRDAPSGDDDYTLERDGKHWLLSCKHGSAFVLGSAAVTELASHMRLANASGGILATQGKVAADARPAAALQRIELLDGPTLWPELRELLPPEQLAGIRAIAHQQARQRILLSWLLAVLAAIATWVLLARQPHENRAPEPVPIATTASASQAVAKPPVRSADEASTAAAPGAAASSAPAPSSAASPVQATTTIAAPAQNDEVALEQQRKDVARAISTLPMVDRAIWTTQSTLQVYLLDTKADAITQICPLLERYDALVSSRVQLTPPAGSDVPTRFRQCRVY